MASPLTIVKQLLSLASDHENQAYIIRESGCMTGLVGYLGHKDVEVVVTAIETVYCLSSDDANRTAVRDQPGLFDKLCSLNASHNPQIRSAAQKTLANLQPPASHASSLLSAYDSQTAPSERRSTAGVGAGGGAGASSTRSSSSSSSHSASRPRPITIKIEGIAEEFWRKLVEDSLIKVSGVISVTLDTRREEAIVFTRKKTGMLDALLKALDSLGVEGTVVGDQANPPFKKQLKRVTAPRYLDDDDEMDSYFAAGAMTANTGCASLEARLAAKRKEQAAARAATTAAATGSKRQRVMGWVGSIGTSIGGWW